MIGMVRAAWAVPEWMRKLMPDWIRNITWATTTRGSTAMALEAAKSMVSMMRASWAMISRARAQATMNTTPTMSLAPVTNTEAMRLGPRRPTTPRAMPMPKNSTAISSMYHFQRSTPTTSRTMQKAKSTRAATLRASQEALALVSSRLPRARSSSRTGLREGSRLMRRA